MKELKLIADSGASNTSWSLITSTGEVLKKLQTKGINPFFIGTREIIELLYSELLPHILQDISSIYFYGAGCGNPEKVEVVKRALLKVFPNTLCYVESDMLGAARALFGNEKGIACILGTGSNSCFYNGKDLGINISPGGFILGDEGSGAVLGKMFAGDFIKGLMPAHIANAFVKLFGISKSELIDRVYRQAHPNRFLASFSNFIAENIHDDYCQSLVYKNFTGFIDRNLMQYPELNCYSAGFVGSVADGYSVILKKAMGDRGLEIHKIIKNPIDDLVKYHAENK